MAYEFCIAREEDLGKITNFWKELDSDFKPRLSDRYNIAKTMEDHFKWGDKFLLLRNKDKDELIGVLIFAENWQNTKDAYIKMLGILPEYRKRGLSKLLLAECLNKLSGKHIPKVHVNTWSTNEKALCLYMKEGFNIAKIEENNESPGIDTVYLEEPLEGIHIKIYDK